MSRHLLSIGENLDIVDQNVGWEGDRNMRDFRVVFANLLTLENTSDKEKSIIFPEREEILEHVLNEGYLFIILPRELDTEINDTELDMISWIPFDVGFEEEEGKSINEGSVANGWEWYFDGSNFKWNICMRDPGQVTLSEDEIDVDRTAVTRTKKLFYEMESLVENRYGRQVAGKIKLGTSEKISIPDMTTTNTEPEFIQGGVYLLPLIENYTYQELVEGVLRNIFEVNLSNEERAPDWTEEYVVPGEEDVSESIKEIEKKIMGLKSEKEEKAEDLAELRRYKGLLYGNEDFLENLVPEVLGKMGFDVEGEIPHGRDGAVLLDNQMLVLEITGTTGGVSLKKCRQLDNWVDEYRYTDSETPKDNCSGALIINPFRETKPDERSGYIDSNTRKFMRDRGHKVITTPALFDIYSEYLEENISQKKIEEVLTDEQTVVDREALRQTLE